jgi:hypothetical protein
MPTSVPAAATRRIVATTARHVLRLGPKRRRASVRAASTASTYSGSERVDSRSQLMNGLVLLSMAPTAPLRERTQKPSA